MPIRYALGLGLAFAAVIVVGLSSVTLTHDRASGQAADVTVYFLEEEMPAPEGSNTTNVSVMLSETITGTVTIPLTVLDESTATADEDYTITSALEIIISGNESGDLTVMIKNDFVSESLEKLVFGFGELPDGYVVGTPSTLTIKIADDDNDTPQGDVTIDSEAKVGETLTAITSEITDRENPDNPDTTEIDPTPPLDFTYQWQRTNGTTDPAEYEDIEGAISSTYPLTEKDVGERLTVKVTSTDQFRNGDDTPHKLEYAHRDGSRCL